MAHPLPSIELLRSLLDYDPLTGKICWSKRGCPQNDHGKIGKGNVDLLTFNEALAGTEALRWDDGEGYLIGSLLGVTRKSHRVAWAIYYGEWPKAPLDHINGVRSDNRIENLREVTFTQNMRNAKKFATNRSGITGVHWIKTSQKWGATISLGNRKVWLGSFSELGQAVTARRAAETKHGFTARHGQ